MQALWGLSEGPRRVAPQGKYPFRPHPIIEVVRQGYFPRHTPPESGHVNQIEHRLIVCETLLRYGGKKNGDGSSKTMASGTRASLSQLDSKARLPTMLFCNTSSRNHPVILVELLCPSERDH